MINILDAGPLIAALNRSDQYHLWACDTLRRLRRPFHTCPEALAEAAAMTQRPAEIVELVEAGEIVPAFFLAEQASPVLRLLRKYSDQGMDLADACIVRMTELMSDCQVVTLDRNDFIVYRRNGRQVIPIVAPPEEG